MLTRRHHRHEVSETTYLELVRSLLGTLVPTAIMAVLFVVTARVSCMQSGTSGMTTIGLIGSAIAVVRVGVVTALRATVARHGLTPAIAPRVERIFAAIYLAFAIAVGAFAAESLLRCPVADQLMVSALIVGYGAGVAAGVSLRPWIAIPAMLLAVIPPAVASAWVGDVAHRTLAFLLLTLMAGGIASIVRRYREAVAMIEMRQRFASLARRDPLTGLANRLALEDGFLQAVGARGGRDVVLHCFDLDRFKPVNDTYGHQVGDLLLEAVALRLNRILRDGDLAVRLGGDEFAVLQTGVEHDDQARLAARRIARTMGEPFSIEGHEIRIGASVGSASGRDHGPDLARLLSAADKALYEVKHAGKEARALAG